MFENNFGYLAIVGFVSVPVYNFFVLTQDGWAEPRSPDSELEAEKRCDCGSAKKYGGTVGEPWKTPWKRGKARTEKLSPTVPGNRTEGVFQKLQTVQESEVEEDGEIDSEEKGNWESFSFGPSGCEVEKHESHSRQRNGRKRPV